MINDPNKKSHEDLRHLLSWDKCAFDIFNELRIARELPPIQKPTSTAPTLYELLSHCQALPNIDRFLIGPEGTILVDVDGFLDRLAPITDHTQYSTGFARSKANYVFAGIILEAASGTSLAYTLEKEVLEKSHMRDTILTHKRFAEEKAHGRIAPGFITLSNLRQAPLRERFDDPVEFAFCGVYTTIFDMATLMRVVSNVEITSGPCQVIVHGYTCKSTPFSLDVPLAGTAVWSQTFEAQLDHIQPLEFRESDMSVTFNFGATDGYNCITVVIPERKTFMVVFVNSIGSVDPAFRIARRVFYPKFFFRI